MVVRTGLQLSGLGVGPERCVRGGLWLRGAEKLWVGGRGGPRRGFALRNPPLHKARRDGHGCQDAPQKSPSEQRHELYVTPVVWRGGQYSYKRYKTGD